MPFFSFASIEMIIWLLSFSCLIWHITLFDLHVLSHFVTLKCILFDFGLWLFLYIIGSVLILFGWWIFDLYLPKILACKFLIFAVSFSGSYFMVVAASWNELGSVISLIFWNNSRRMDMSSLYILCSVLGFFFFFSFFLFFFLKI